MSKTTKSGPTISQSASLSGWRSARVLSRAAIIALCFVLLCSALVLVQVFAADHRARDQVNSTKEVLGSLRKSLRAGVDAETGQRGFLLVDDPAYLVPYERGAAEWLPALEQLDRTFEETGTAEQRAAVDKLQGLARAKLDELARTITFVQKGRSEDALALVRTDEGKNLMEMFRELVMQLEREEETVLARALEDARVTEARTILTLGIMGVAILGLVSLSLRLERRTAWTEAAAREAVELKLARERSDLLAHELNHRVKNLFAVILSIVNLSGRGQTDVNAVVRNLRARIHALSRAHEVSQGQLDTKIVGLRDVLSATLGPHAPTEDGAERVTLTGEPVELPVKAVTPIGLVIHELATNAAKYGALSVVNGRIEVDWTIRDGQDRAELELVWREHGGPPPRAKRTDGFGSAMMKQSAMQLDGRIELEWPNDGVRATLVFPLEGVQ